MGRITINVLWTGGLDSTFRICELSRHNVRIQPYYILCDRGSEEYELKAIDNITKILRSHDDVKAEILNVIVEQLPKDMAEEYRAFKSLKSRYGLGIQYVWLSKFAKLKDIRLEIALENSVRSKATVALKTEGALQLENYDSLELGKTGEYYKCSKSGASQDCWIIFEKLNIPSNLFSLSKQDEVEILKQLNMYDIALNTWFCHSPILGYPCGRCSPCRDALNEGMGWRVPLIGRALGVLRAMTYVPSWVYHGIKSRVKINH